jgi:uncharacterized protein
MSSQPESSLPPYTYVPGGPWPHPTASPKGHSWGLENTPVSPIMTDRWESSRPYLRGIELFNAGYYWEAHESWEALWHAHGRRGATAGVLQGLIKLAAAGVKIRERRPGGVCTLASRAAVHFENSRLEAGRYQLGLDLDEWIERARAISVHSPLDPAVPGSPVARVFDFRLEPRVPC